MNREAFEKLPEIATVIDCFWFNVDHNRYQRNTVHISNDVTAWLNGAWYAWQEQQKKIEEVLQQLDFLQEHYWSRWKERADMMDQGASVAYEHSYWMLEEKLQ